MSYFNELLFGTDGDDYLTGSSGNDLMSGHNGNDVLNGGLGRDKLTGGAGNDVLIGGKDMDQLNGGAGNDVLIGGNGGDLFELSKGHDVITDFARSEGDIIYINPFEFDTGTISIKEIDSNTILRFDSGDTTVISGATGSDVYHSIMNFSNMHIVAENFDVYA